MPRVQMCGKVTRQDSGRYRIDCGMCDKLIAKEISYSDLAEFGSDELTRHLQDAHGLQEGLRSNCFFTLRVMEAVLIRTPYD
jgi:hypothetical protein